EVSREALGRLLETAVEALLSGAQIGLERRAAQAQIIARAAPPAPAPAPSPAAPAGPPRRERAAPSWRAELALMYEAQGFAPEALAAHGPVVGVWVGSTRGRVRPGVW